MTQTPAAAMPALRCPAGSGPGSAGSSPSAADSTAADAGMFAQLMAALVAPVGVLAPAGQAQTEDPASAPTDATTPETTDEVADATAVPSPAVAGPVLVAVTGPMTPVPGTGPAEPGVRNTATRAGVAEPARVRPLPLDATTAPVAGPTDPTAKSQAPVAPPLRTLPTPGTPAAPHTAATPPSHPAAEPTDLATPGTQPAPATTPLAPVITSSQATPSPVAAPVSPVSRQVIPELTRMSTLGPGTHRLTMTLRPEALGEVRVTMTVRDGSIHVRLAAGSEAQHSLVPDLTELQQVLKLGGTTDVRVVVRDLATGQQTPGQHPAHTGDPAAGQQGAGLSHSPDHGPGTSAQSGHHSRREAGTPRDINATDGAVDGTQRSRSESVRQPRVAGIDLTM